MVKPFVKWAGGKSRLSQYIISLLPSKRELRGIKKYVEPFVGGGAILFSISSRIKINEIIINDKNSALINTYITIKENLEGLIINLERIQDEFDSLDNWRKEKFFYSKRKQYNKLIKSEKSDHLLLSSLLIFLNKTCYNGLYRTNRNGEFNVPFGDNNNPIIYDKDNLSNVNKLLRKAKMEDKDYQVFFSNQNTIDSNTLIYVDPPYTIKHGNNGFISYNEKLFSWDDQVQLSQILSEFHKLGALIIVSNANNEDIKSLYDDINFFTHSVTRKSVIGGTVESRGDVKEYIFTSYKPTSQQNLIE